MVLELIQDILDYQRIYMNTQLFLKMDKIKIKRVDSLKQHYVFKIFDSRFKKKSAMRKKGKKQMVNT